ncbi:26S proteasome regulatory subunit N6 [Pancytospora philotis]|nr:26S proteasome regulatory subunit N6 [Pancytospora philotis]
MRLTPPCHFKRPKNLPMLRAELEKYNTMEEKEAFVVDTCRELTERGDYSKMLGLLSTLQTDWEDLSTVRLTKIIKRVLDGVPLSAESYEGVLLLLGGLIETYKSKKMLSLDLQCKEIHALLSIGKYADCLRKIAEVFKELKKFDDRINMISLYVYESKAYYALDDFARAKASLTSARATAVSAACPSSLQAQIDLLNGMYLSDEKAYGMAVSYFIEAAEGFTQDRLPEMARMALRYIVLAKIMDEHYDDVPIVLETKYAQPIRQDKYVGILLDINEACRRRDLASYREVLSNYGSLLETDAYIFKHLCKLYNVLLDRNIIKIIEPYSHVKLKFIAHKLSIDVATTETKLRKMILDKSINGIIDHVTQCLIITPDELKRTNTIVEEIAALEGFFDKN